MTDIVWEEPAPPGGHGGPRTRWIDRLIPLLEHPKRWAVVAEVGSTNSACTSASHLRRAEYTRPPGRWEFTSRGKSVYARYMGPEEEA